VLLPAEIIMSDIIFVLGLATILYSNYLFWYQNFLELFVETVNVINAKKDILKH